MTRDRQQGLPDGDHGKLASVSGTRRWLVKPPWLGAPAWLAKPFRLSKSAGWPSRRVWRVVVPSTLALFGLVAAVTYVIVSSGGPAPSRLRPVAAASPNPDSTEPIPQFHVPAQVVPVALPSTGAIPLPTYAQPAVKTWKAGPGGAALTAVTTQAGAVSQAEGLKEYVEMKSACADLASGVTAARDAPAIPDSAMQVLYQKALTSLATAAGQCKTAIFEQPEGEEYVATTENSSALRAAAAALSSGSKYLFQATGEIAALDQGQ
jgi:hypothetical protein